MKNNSVLAILFFSLFVSCTEQASQPLQIIISEYYNSLFKSAVKNDIVTKFQKVVNNKSDTALAIDLFPTAMPFVYDGIKNSRSYGNLITQALILNVDNYPNKESYLLFLTDFVTRFGRVTKANTDLIAQDPSNPLFACAYATLTQEKPAILVKENFDTNFRDIFAETLYYAAASFPKEIDMNHISIQS